MLKNTIAVAVILVALGFPSAIWPSHSLVVPPTSTTPTTLTTTSTADDEPATYATFTVYALNVNLHVTDIETMFNLGTLTVGAAESTNLNASNAVVEIASNTFTRFRVADPTNPSGLFVAFNLRHDDELVSRVLVDLSIRLPPSESVHYMHYSQRIQCQYQGVHSQTNDLDVKITCAAQLEIRVDSI